MVVRGVGPTRELRLAGGIRLAPVEEVVQVNLEPLCLLEVELVVGKCRVERAV